MEKANIQLQSLIQELKTAASREKVMLWKAIALSLEKPTRQRDIVNLSKINMLAKDNETVIVAGKVLASGELERKITVAAFKFSREAEKKISKKGKAITISQLLKDNPKGKNARVLA